MECCCPQAFSPSTGRHSAVDRLAWHPIRVAPLHAPHPCPHARAPPMHLWLAGEHRCPHVAPKDQRRRQAGLRERRDRCGDVRAAPRAVRQARSQRVADAHRGGAGEANGQHVAEARHLEPAMDDEGAAGTARVVRPPRWQHESCDRRGGSRRRRAKQGQHTRGAPGSPAMGSTGRSRRSAPAAPGQRSHPACTPPCVRSHDAHGGDVQGGVGQPAGHEDAKLV